MGRPKLRSRLPGWFALALTVSVVSAAGGSSTGVVSTATLPVVHGSAAMVAPGLRAELVIADPEGAAQADDRPTGLSVDGLNAARDDAASGVPMIAAASPARPPA